ncbi:hypothetical protein Tco_0006395 [Tanacetum coccineum]
MQNIQEEDVLNIPRMIGQHDEEEEGNQIIPNSKIPKIQRRWPVVSRVVIDAVVVKVEDGSPYLSANIESVYLCSRLMTSIRDIRKVVKEHGQTRAIVFKWTQPTYVMKQWLCGHATHISTQATKEFERNVIGRCDMQSEECKKRLKLAVVESAIAKEEEEVAEALFELAETFAYTDRKGTAKA